MGESAGPKLDDGAPIDARGAAAPEDSAGKLGAFVDFMRVEFKGDVELVKQALADLNAQQRQDARNHFEARQEYIKQVADHDRRATEGLIAYGLQTLKWSFLLNAGAIAVVLAYVGGLIGKAPNGQVSTYTPLIKALWPFAVGCSFVVLAGAAAFFNFSYASASLPSPENLHGFLDPKSSKFPGAKFQKPDEAPVDFFKRFSWKVGACRKLAIFFALGSGCWFVYGVYRVMRVAVG